MEENHYTGKRRELIESLEKSGNIKTEKVKAAMLKVRREYFMWKSNKLSSYHDSPQSLGNTGQTISAPHMVAIMLEEMNLSPGQKVLEVGTGSGYNAALMAEMTRSPHNSNEKNCQIISIERMDDLVKVASKNLKRAGYSDIVSVHSGDGTLGYPEKSENEIYDRIMVTAAAPHTPKYLLKQLKRGGLLLIPVGERYVQNLLKITKNADNKLDNQSVCECIFVPLLGEDGYS
ncbi:MAG: protein-L-isoaspartate(D-aspartate) O-methyltransferase [Anaerolineales bacterium]|nr:protein-L-isoaspartate(D-aspartate) O-methyltransferase [Anaerolineales bacterium]